MGIESFDLSGGELTTYESGDGATHLYSRSLATAGTLTAGARTDRGATQRCGVMAGDYGSCPDLRGTGDGRAVIHDAAGEVSVLDRGRSFPAPCWPPASRTTMASWTSRAGMRPGVGPRPRETA